MTRATKSLALPVCLLLAHNNIPLYGKFLQLTFLIRFNWKMKVKLCYTKSLGKSSAMVNAVIPHESHVHQRCAKIREVHLLKLHGPVEANFRGVQSCKHHWKPPCLGWTQEDILVLFPKAIQQWPLGQRVVWKDRFASFSLDRNGTFQNKQELVLC